jgi:hypothetical protein
MYLLSFVALTSAALYGWGRRQGWSARALGAAAWRTLECLGLALALLALNLVTGVLMALAMRVATRSFISLYGAADLTLVPLSLGQAILFLWWRALAAASRGQEPERPVE